MNIQKPLIQIKELTKLFKCGQNFLRAVSNLSLSLFEQETLGLAGESGCGKSTLGKLLVRLIEPTKGSIWFDNQNIHLLKGKELKEMRRHIQMVFQNPSGALNPRMTVEEIVEEPLIIHHLDKSIARKNKCLKILNQVGIASNLFKRLPDELSGGQKQRVAIARALILNPRFLVLDEPLSALDVSIQAQIANLLKDLQKEYGLTYLFISHDLAVMRHLAHRVAIMYLGEIVELASSRTLWQNPLHPYTQALLSAIPSISSAGEGGSSRIILKGEIPSSLFPPKGCSFHTRCPFAIPICQEIKPLWQEIEKDHFVACHRISSI